VPDVVLYCIHSEKIGIGRIRFKDDINACSVRLTYLFGRTGGSSAFQAGDIRTE